MPDHYPPASALVKKIDASPFPANYYIRSRFPSCWEGSSSRIGRPIEKNPGLLSAVMSPFSLLQLSLPVFLFPLGNVLDHKGVIPELEEI
jgi:hypothetical protein